MYNRDDRKKFAPISAKIPHMIHGGDYNPDQWLPIDPDVLPKDAKVFRVAGINSASVCIFGWASVEPEEGVYNFEWLDKTLDTLYENGIYTILATPTGARPAWLDAKYPEAMRTDNCGVKATHGRRHNHCYTSLKYRELSKGIITKLAERYKDHPGLMMWHLNNEYGGECFCDNCKAAFRSWLRERYRGDINALNTAWWTRFWSHAFTSFEQIDPPSPIGEMAIHGLDLDWHRFVTFKTNEYMNMEFDTVKSITPDVPVTANYMDMYQGLDYAEMRDKLDVMSWDNYPEFGANGRDDTKAFTRAAFNHDFFRTLRKKPFLVMESTPSAVNWKSINKLKRPGLHLLSSLHGVAHGADSVQYFQLRKSRGASEMLHGAVIDHVGHELNLKTRVFHDVVSVGEALAKLDDIVGTCTPSEVAVLYDIDNRNMLDVKQGYNNIKKNDRYVETLFTHYGMFTKGSVNVDVLPVADDFSSYKLIVVPMLYLMKKDTVAKLEKFVVNGGTVVMTYLSAYVGDTGLHYMEGLPADELKKVFGIWNEECDALYPNDRVGVEYLDNNIGLTDNTEASTFAELVHLEGAKAIARYTTEFYAGMPAVTVNEYGKGRAYYIAAELPEKELRRIYDGIIAEAGVSRTLEGLPEGVEATFRADEKSEYVFVMNMTEDEKKVHIDGGEKYVDILTGNKVGEDFTMPSYSIIIYKR